MLRSEVGAWSFQSRKQRGRAGLIYLAGPIENAPGSGRDWRYKADKALRAMGYQVYNPSTDEQKLLEPYGLKTAEEFHELKVQGNLREYRRIMGDITDYDLKKLFKADAILALLGSRISGGTASECTIMRRIIGGPVFGIISPEEISKQSGWTLGQVTHFFKGLSVALDYIRKYGFVS